MNRKKIKQTRKQKEKSMKKRGVEFDKTANSTYAKKVRARNQGVENPRSPFK